MSYIITESDNTWQAIFNSLMHYYLLHNCGFIGFLLKIQEVRLSGASHDGVLEHLCAVLTATETVYPGTDLRLVFEPVRASQVPRDQES
jgi:hypothetical protein